MVKLYFASMLNVTVLNVSLNVGIRFTEIACSLTLKEIQQEWEWLQKNLDTLTSFEKEEEVTEYVCGKIRSMIAENQYHNYSVEGKLP